MCGWLVDLGCEANSMHIELMRDKLGDTGALERVVS